jgi:regulator of RNase E activity RraA
VTPRALSTRRGDIIVVDARADMRSGVFGEMMLTYFKGRGDAGVVIDVCVRDYPHVKTLELGLWLRGVTPNFHTQTGHDAVFRERADCLRVV